MHALDWNDLRYVLAIARERTYAAAARRLKTDPTTIARRLRSIETALNVKLFERDSDGWMGPTEAGEVAVRRAEVIETEIGSLTASVKGADASVSGSVRVTAVPILVNRVLIPAAPSLIARHPDLRLELIGDSRDLSLTRREADVALRLARPGEEVGSRVLARRIGTLGYAAYAATNCHCDPRNLPWLTYEEGMSHLLQAKWINRAAEQSSGYAAIALNDADSLLHAVEAGLGRSLLPCIVADSMPGLVRIAVAETLPEREIWTLTHPDLRPLARVAAVLEWLEEVLGK
jgi:DNA-binding transcriptional LysR family regulator